MVTSQSYTYSLSSIKRYCSIIPRQGLVILCHIPGCPHQVLRVWTVHRMERQYSRGPYHDRYRFWCTSILFILGSRVRSLHFFLQLCVHPSLCRTNLGLPLSPPSSPRLGPAHSDIISPFDPSMPGLTDTNSVVLPASKTALYLDKALIALGLHIEARTSFITYVTTSSIILFVQKIPPDIGFHPF